ncbi:isochorismate synthase DhbC [Methylophilus sp. OH31]|uniref:isochorismate synthase DhbC n=1 Tax=Methylophilus sp. OH31 TaxID=1387312 RepID=UPI0004644020|nr:isochorismate synthase DhbC [Methylophilus sp. OH31]
MNDIFRGLTGDPQAEKLLARYNQETPFFFTTPEQSMLAQGRYATIPATANMTELNLAVNTALADAVANGHPDPIVVGAIPFDTQQPACLFIPQQVVHAGPLPREGYLPPPHAAACQVTPTPAPEVYAHGVSTAVQQIRDHVLSKVVLARTLELTTNQPVDLQGLLQRLAWSNALGYTFAVDLGTTAQGTLIGASPELLLSRQGKHVRSNPLAGSIPRVKDSSADFQRSQGLLQSGKDLHEHKVVADAVAQALRPYCKMLSVPALPSLINTETMWHLSSDIYGELTSPPASALTLAASLHPTPAVCGHPFDQARNLINALEGFDRGFYSGMVGWCDAAGNGEWIVTLRCAKVAGQHVRLFAGAGVVADSEPQHELAETTAKFRTMLNALGLVQEAA